MNADAQPTMAITFGFSESGLLIDEVTVLQVAHPNEDTTGWQTRGPEMQL